MGLEEEVVGHRITAVDQEVILDPEADPHHDQADLDQGVDLDHDHAVQGNLL